MLRIAERDQLRRERGDPLGERLLRLPLEAEIDQDALVPRGRARHHVEEAERDDGVRAASRDCRIRTRSSQARDHTRREG
jgi:hypothetical protein